MNLSEQKQVAASGITYRRPELKDGAEIYQLVQSCKPLDLNSLYSYILLCEHFADTCIVAEYEGRVSGYISGYQPPNRTDTLFVWQVAVGEQVRKKGVALEMIKGLLDRDNLKEVSWIETTVTPSNQPSTRLFESVARFLTTTLKTSSYFTQDLFAGQAHEEELLFRIGPFSIGASNS